MFAAGIDVGSVAAKAVIFDTASRNMAGGTVLPTGWNTREAGERALAAACGQAGVDRADLARIVATGYGRIALPFAHKTVTEITCHARGASWLFPGSGVVLDIGGQDSKAISLDENGGVRDFVMNDKCAAGTGRFLQVLAGILGMPLDGWRQSGAHLEHVRSVCGNRNRWPAGAGNPARRSGSRSFCVHSKTHARPCTPYFFYGAMCFYRRHGYKPGVLRLSFPGTGNTCAGSRRTATGGRPGRCPACSASA